MTCVVRMIDTMKEKERILLFLGKKEKSMKKREREIERMQTKSQEGSHRRNSVLKKF